MSQGSQVSEVIEGDSPDTHVQAWERQGARIVSCFLTDKAIERFFFMDQRE